MNELKAHIAQINRLCKQYRVKSLFAFGSVVSDRFSADSDIDLVVDIDSDDPLDYSDRYFDLKFQLEDMLKRPIDLLEEKAIRNPLLKKEIDSTKVLIYG